MAIALEKGLGLSWNLVFQRGKRLPIEDSTLNHSYAHLLWELNQDNSIVPNTSQDNKGGSGNFYVGHITSIPYAWGENGAYTQAKYPENTLDTKGPWYVTYCDTDEDPNPGVTGKYAFPGHGKNGNGNTYYADRIVLRQELDYALDSNYVNKYQIGTYYTGVGLWWDSWQKAREYVEKGIEVPDGTYFESHTYGEIFNDYAYNRAEGTYSHAEGYHTYALGDYSHTEGKGTLVKRSYSHAEGIDTIALGYGAHAEGIGCLAYCSDDYEGSKPANGAHAEGIYTTAYGEGTHTEGAYNVAYNEASHAEGYHNITRPFCSHVEGCDNNIINGSFSHVEGCDNINYGINSHVEGSYNVAYGTISHVSGSYNVTYSTASHAEGQYNVAYGNVSHAEGVINVAYGNVSHAEGQNNVAYGNVSHAEGQYNVAYGNVSHAEGQYSVAYGNISHAEGQYSVAYGNISHAEGINNVTYSTASHAEGINNVTYSTASHAEGINNVAYGFVSHAEGQYNVAYRTASHAEGINNVAYSTASHAEGKYNVAYGDTSHAEGQYNVAYGNVSHAEGERTASYAAASHTEGSNTIAYGSISHAEGIYNVAYGFASHAEGYKTITYSNYSHAEGSRTITNGQSSHAEGWETYANGEYAHAEGWETYANGLSSHAEGWETYANGLYSHAEGVGTVAYHRGEHVQGRFNDYKSYIGLLNYVLFSIGDGYDDGDRHNVMMIVGDNARNTSQVLIDARNTVYLNATGYKNSNGKLCAYSDNLYLTSPNATLTFDYANLNFKDMHLHTENVACIKSKESYIKGDTITYVGRDTHGGDTAYTYIVGDKITTYVKTGDNVTVVDNGDNLLSVKKGNMSVDVSKNIIVTPGQYTYNYSQHLTLGGKGQIANGNNSAVFGTLNKATANDTFALGTGLRSYETSKVAVGKWNNAYVDGIFEIGIGTKDDDRKNAMSVMTDGISYFHYQPYTYDSYINSVTYGSWDGNAYTKYSPSDYPDESHLVSDSYFRMSYNALFTTTKTVVDNLGSVDSVQSLDEITRSYTDNVLHYTTGHYDQTQEKYITSKHNIQQESATKELAGLMSGEDKVRSDDLEDRLNAVVKAASLPTFSLNTVTWKVYNNDKSKVLATYNNVTSITAEYGTYVTAENYTIKMNLNGNYDASFLATVTTKGPFGTKVPSFSPIVNGTAVMDGTNSLASTYISPYTGGVTSKNVTTDNQTVRAVTQFGMKYLSTKTLANGHTQVYRINDPDTYSEGNGFNIKVSGAFSIIKWYGTTTVNPATFPASITQQALEAYMTGQNNKSNSNNKNLSSYAAKTDTANKFFFYVYRKALGVLSKAEVPGADATAWFNTKNPKTITVTRTTTGMKEDYYLVYSLNENALNGALLTFS